MRMRHRSERKAEQGAHISRPGPELRFVLEAAMWIPNYPEWTSGPPLKVDDHVTADLPAPLTWWDRLLWRLFRIEHKRPTTRQTFVVTDVYPPRTEWAAKMGADRDSPLELDRLRAENTRLLGLLDYGTDTDAYNKMRAENERLRAALITAAQWMPQPGAEYTEDAKIDVRQVQEALGWQTRK